MTEVKKSLTLNTGASMPLVGLGTWKSGMQNVGSAVTFAVLESGYRHIDCASIYGNEKQIGTAFNEIFGNSRAKREDVFITSKLWNADHAKDAVRPAYEATLRDLCVDYVDLYLMHWGIATPAGEAEPLDEHGVLLTEKVSVRETWEEMGSLVEEGLVKAIGVANFTAPMIIDLLSYAKIIPAVNQIELHPYLQQGRLVEFCQHKKIAVTAYSPLGRPSSSAPRPLLEDEEYSSHLIDDKVIIDISRAHGKTPAQVLIRWAVQRNTVVIPKSVHPKRIRENIEVFDFELSQDEMLQVQRLEREARIVDPYGWWKIPYFD